MTMENLSRIEDPEFMRGFMEKLATEVLGRATEERILRLLPNLEQLAYDINEGRKVADKGHFFRDIINKLGQDYRLSWDEIDKITEQILEK